MDGEVGPHLAEIVGYLTILAIVIVWAVALTLFDLWCEREKEQIAQFMRMWGA